MEKDTITFDEWYKKNRLDINYMKMSKPELLEAYKQEITMGLKGYNDITLEELEKIIAETVFEEERKEKGWRILTNKKGALSYLKELYKDPPFVDKAEKLLKEAEEEFTEGPYVITPYGVSPYGFRLKR